jgi:parvulin-like peptidyl-prolyl isomerase
MKSAVIMFGFFFLMSFSAAAGEDRVVAKIGEEKITASQFERILKLYEAQRRRQMERNPRFKRMILEKYVEGIVLSKKAKEKNLDTLPEVKDRIEMVTNEILSRAYIQKEVVEKIVISEEEMRRYYENHKGEFTKPEQVSLRQIFIKVDASASEEDRKKSRERAEEIKKKLEQGDDFATLAAQFSDDPEAKKKGGSLGFVRRGKLAPDIDQVVFSLQPGQISDVTETAKGYFILKVDEVKESMIQPFDAVKDHLREKVLLDLKRRSINEFHAKAMKEAGVEFYLGEK